jgi:uncharacterized protein
VSVEPEPHQLLLHGIELFNSRQFFDSHEVLEDLWNQQSLPDKEFTQGIIQIAVGFYHLLRGNFEGANKLLARGTARVGKFPGNYLGFDTASFLTAVKEVADKSNLQQSVSESDLPRVLRLTK